MSNRLQLLPVLKNLFLKVSLAEYFTDVQYQLQSFWVEQSVSEVELCGTILIKLKPFLSSSKDIESLLKIKIGFEKNKSSVEKRHVQAWTPGIRTAEKNDPSEKRKGKSLMMAGTHGKGKKSKRKEKKRRVGCCGVDTKPRARRTGRDRVNDSRVSAGCGGWRRWGHEGVPLPTPTPRGWQPSCQRVAVMTRVGYARALLYLRAPGGK